MGARAFRKYGLLAALMCSGAWAQTASSYPAKPIRVIVPGAPGDSCDTMLRLIGLKFVEKTGQPFVVDNRPGAVGIPGTQAIAQATADGYTIGCGQGGTLVIASLAHKKMPFDTRKDFTPITLMVSNFVALTVHANAPHKTTKELITFAKANPGKLSFGTSGEGAFLHFATELLRKEAGFSYYHVPFKTGGLIVTDLIGGRIDATLAAFIAVQPQAAAGRLHILGIARENRLPNYPQIPTLSETGVPGFAAGGWFGAIGPAGMPKPIVAMLNREMNAALKTPDIREKAALLGLEIHTEAPEFFAETIRRDFEKWGKLAREIDFKPR